MQVSLDFRTLHRLYLNQPENLLRILAEIQIRILKYPDPAVWISKVEWNTIFTKAEELLRLQAKKVDYQSFPLFGLPFAVKDNIDISGMLTTAGCPAFAYPAATSAASVERLESAGAILIGKTNMDQFATGLVGTRSPYGVVKNSFNPLYISGGSSSGSAVVVASGLVSFALGTDTAGSGRVPAGFNNIVGLKPTRGLISTAGVFPACRSLDCVSVFALTCNDAYQVLELAKGKDEADAFSRSEAEFTSNSVAMRKPIGQKNETRFRFSIPDSEHLELFGDTEALALFEKACVMLESLGGKRVEISFAPFAETANLLYQGPWLAERQVAFGDFMESHPTDVLPVIGDIMSRAKAISAEDYFRAYYKLKELKAKSQALFQKMDILLVPTTPAHYTISEINADPVGLNTKLGMYTNFVNLLDLCALAIPGSLRSNGLPFGITLIGNTLHDDLLSKIGQEYQTRNGINLGATNQPMPKENLTMEKPANALSLKSEHLVKLAVAGLHLSGQPLNHQLTSLHASLVGTFKTAANYRFYAISLPGKTIPGLVRQIVEGTSIEVEVWEMTNSALGAFMANVNAPLCIGSLELESGEWVKGFLSESYGIVNAIDISRFGSWRNYLAQGLP